MTEYHLHMWQCFPDADETSFVTGMSPSMFSSSFLKVLQIDASNENSCWIAMHRVIILILSCLTAQGWGNEQTSFARMSRSGTRSGSVTPSLDSPTPTPRHNCSSESLSGLFIPTGSRGTNNVQSRRDSDPLINRTVQRSGSGASVRAKNILKLKADSPKGLTALFQVCFGFAFCPLVMYLTNDKKSCFSYLPRLHLQDTCLKYGDLLKSNDSSRSALNRIVTSVSNKAWCVISLFASPCNATRNANSACNWWPWQNE